MTDPGTRVRFATPPERELWLACQLAPDPAIFTTAHAFDFTDGVDAEALALAWDHLVAAVPLLSSRFTNRDGHVEVVAQPESAPRLALTPVADTEAVTARREAVRRLVLDPRCGPLGHAELIRDAATGTDTLAIAISHLAVDGFGWSILLRELQRAYTLIRDGEAVTAAKLTDPVPMEVSPDSAAWARGNLAGQPHPSRQPIPARQARPRAAAPLPTTPKLSRLPQLALAAAAVAAAPGDGRTRVTVDVPFLARNGALFRAPSTAMNVVPLVIELTDDVPELLDRCATALERARPHAHARTEQARREHTGTGAPAPVADIAMNLIPFTFALVLDAKPGVARTLSSGPGDVAAVGVRGRTDGGFDVEVDAPAADGLDAEAASARLLERFVSALTELERGRYPTEAPVTTGTVPPDVLERVGAHVATAPDAAAFIDGDTGATTGYGEIWAAAGNLARRLAERGVTTEHTVAVAAPRGPHHAIAVLGVLRAGAAFVPLPAEPVEGAARRRIVETVRLDAIVGPRPAPEFGDIPFLPTLTDATTAGPCEPAHPQQLAYVIATSGSTGVPKPVAVNRGALSSWVTAILADYLAIDATDRLAQFAAVQFDASVEELFAALCSGAALIPRGPQALADIGAWLESCARLRVTVLDLPTGYWHELVHALASGTARLPDSVHTVIIGGEAASPERLRQWRATASPRVRLVNTYGPTEATVVATRQVLAGPPLP